MNSMEYNINQYDSKYWINISINLYLDRLPHHFTLVSTSVSMAGQAIIAEEVEEKAERGLSPYQQAA